MGGMRETLRWHGRHITGGMGDTLRWHGRHIMGDTLWVVWETHYGSHETDYVMNIS